MIGRRYFGQMRLKLTVWGQMEGNGCGKKNGEGLSDRLVEGTKKFGGGSLMMWGCMTWEGVGYACKIDGKMDGDLYVQILDEELKKSIKFNKKTKNKII